MCGTVMRGAVAPPGSKATSRQKGMRRNLRDLTLDHRLQSRWPASGRRGAEADDARAGEVRPRHSSDEVAEQNRGTGSGGDGAKGGGRGERAPAPHALDTEPGKRVRRAGTRTDGRKALPSLSEVGAGCGKAASVKMVEKRLSEEVA